MGVETLAMFAAGRAPGGRECSTCASVPRVVRNEIAKTKKDLPGISWPTISAWLKERRGISLKPNTLRSHFVGGHDKEKTS